MNKTLVLPSVIVSLAGIAMTAQPAVAVTPTPNATTVEGVSVDVIQRQLTAAGATVKATGVWDPATADAWKWFTGKFTLWPTKSVTPAKLTRLQAVAAKADIPRACKVKGTVICGDRRLRVVRVMRNGKQIDSADAIFGKGRYATRKGTHRVHTRTRFLISDLSHTAMPYSLFFSGGQAIHYSKAFDRDGYNIGTLGCVGLADKSFAKRLFANSPVGRKVVVH